LENRIEFLREHPNAIGAREERVILNLVWETIKQMIPNYFDSVRSGPATLYRRFATEALTPGDAVITFNYDLAVDRELKRSDKWSIGDGYGFSVPPFGNSLCKLFKLHGSTNWSGELFHGARGFFQSNSPPLGYRPVIQSSEFEYLGYENGSDPECHSASVRLGTIIMPTENKKFFIESSAGRQLEEFWDSIWSRAAAALRNSSEVYLIGYSLPKYDTRARELITTSVGNGASMTVCCADGTDDVVESLKNFGKSAHASSHLTFEGWLASM
jgi:hypothetical protein